MPDVGQRCVEVSLGHLFCRTGEAVQRGCDLPDLQTTEQEDSCQTEEHDCQDDDVQHASVLLYYGLGYHHHDGPLCESHIAIADPRWHTVDDGRNYPQLTLQGNVFVECVLQHALLVGMDDVATIAVDDATIGLLPKLHVFAVGLLDILQHIVPQILERKVGTEHGHRSSFTVVDGYGVCSQQARRHVGRQQRSL